MMAAMSELEITVGGSVHEPRLALRGEIDIASVVGLRAAVDALPGAQLDHLTLDLTEVSFLDSTALGWLAGLARGGCAVTLVGTSPSITKLLSITGIDGVVTVVG